MISFLSLIFIVAKNIFLATLLSLAAVTLPLPVQCHCSPPWLIVFFTTGEANTMI